MSIRDKMTELADYIREKTNSNEQLSLDEMLEIMPELGSKSDKQLCEVLNTIIDDNIELDVTLPSDLEVLDGNNEQCINDIFFYHKIRNLNTNNVITISNIGNKKYTDVIRNINMSNNKLKNIITSFNNKNEATNTLEFPDSLEVIKNSFVKFNYGNLESIKFGENIKIIENSFYKCYNVKHIELPDKPILLNGVGFLDRIYYNSGFNTVKNDFSELYENYFYILKGTHILINYIDQDIINIPEGITSIGECCFANSKASQINIPNTVVAIGNRAFYGCNNLTTITIPESVTMIGCNCFDNCNKLRKIDVNYSNLEYIGNKYTWGYANLADLNANNNILYVSDNYSPSPILNISVDNEIPDNKYKDTCFYGFVITDNITKIGKHAFENSSNLHNIAIASNMYNLSENNYYSSKLECIDDYAFYNCINLTSLFERSYYTKLNLKRIGKYAFAECVNIHYCNIPYSVIEIDDYAFYNTGKNYRYNTINLKDSQTAFTPNLKRIGKYAFARTDTRYYPASNTTLTIPSSVTEIDDYAFYNQTKFTSIVFENGSNLKRIGNNAFDGCTSLTSITIPEGVTEIGVDAFSNCYNITNITLPSTLISIGVGAFTNCSRISSINLPDSLTNIINSEDNNYTDIFYQSTNLIFSQNLNLKQTFHRMFKATEVSINIPNSVKKIGNDSFSNYTSLTSITIPEGVTEIGNKAFYYCTALTNIIIPEGVTKIGNNAFYNCTSLTSITIPEGVTEIYEYTFYCCTSLTSITIPEGVTKIYDYAFSGCTSLTSITIPEGVTEIGVGAFSSCTSLTSITIPEGVTEISVGAFRDCTALTNIVIPEGVTKIGNNAFSGCTSLTNIVIPDSVTEIYECAFSGCTSLTSIVIPEGVTKISYDAFINCSNLESIILPNTLVNIDADAFNGCTSLTSITIPEGVTEIGNNAFSGCTSLTNIVIPDSVTEIGNGVFNNCPLLSQINRVTTNDNILIDLSGIGITSLNNVINNSMVNIPKNTFSGCNGLTNVSIPENITIVDDYAFYNCANIESVSFLNENIGIFDGAFSDCSSLENITFKNNRCKYIGNYAFSGCSIRILDLPDCNYLESGAFSNCTNLQQINFSENITKIDPSNFSGAGVFSGCTSLKKVIIPSNLKYTNDSTFYNCINLKYAYVCDNHEYINFYNTGANTIKRVCKYINNQPYKLSLWNIKYLHQFSLSSYPNNPMILVGDFSDKVYLDQENAQLVELETEYPVALDSNTSFVSFKFVPVESGNYYITATDVTQQYNGAPGYSFYLYDFTAETTVHTYYMGDGDKFYTELISNHEYYFSIYRYTTDTCKVHIHKYNGDFIKYASCGSYIANNDNLSLDELKEIKLYINYNSTDYEITMNEYIPRDENDTCNYISYYGDLSKNPYATNVYNCTENVNDFPFFIYIDNSKNINISIDPFEDETMYLGGANQYNAPIEILTDIPEEIWDENEESSNS